MTNFERLWVEHNSILPEHKDMRIEQVTAWILIDGRFLLVSEDGVRWQFPGGGALANESAAQAIQREVYEEIGQLIDMSNLHMLGYYQIFNKTTGDTYLQPRFFTRSLENFKGDFSSNHTADEDAIASYQIAPREELVRLFRWLEGSPEYKSLMQIL